MKRLRKNWANFSQKMRERNATGWCVVRRALAPLDAIALSRLAAEVDRLGVAGVAVRCDVSVATVYRLLRGAAPSRGVARRVVAALDDLDEHRGEGVLQRISDSP